jgi:hypothetical protein
VTGGIETVTTFVQDLPKTLTGRDEGNFDQEKLRKAYDRAVAYAGNRQIYRMNIYKDYVKLTIANPARENAYDDITMRGAVVDSRPDGTSASIRPEEIFRVSDTNFATLEHALGDARRQKIGFPMSGSAIDRQSRRSGSMHVRYDDR